MGKSAQGGPHLQVHHSRGRRRFQACCWYQPYRKPKCGLVVLWFASYWDTACSIQRHSGYWFIVRICRKHMVAVNQLLTHSVRSDLWIADQNCIAGCNSVPTFNAIASTTFRNLSTPFQIKYGSGQASGVLGEDVVQMAGFSVANQVFGMLLFACVSSTCPLMVC